MNLQALLPFDISITKHKGNPQSLAANKKVSKAESREQVMYELLHCGPLTCKELAQKLGKAMHQISGRITELKKLGMVEPTGQVRNGGGVVRVRRTN